jgi:hypothetical protein
MGLVWPEELRAIQRADGEQFSFLGIYSRHNLKPEKILPFWAWTKK